VQINNFSLKYLDRGLVDIPKNLSIYLELQGCDLVSLITAQAKPSAVLIRDKTRGSLKLGLYVIVIP
jgi:hypothetical protein